MNERHDHIRACLSCGRYGRPLNGDYCQTCIDLAANKGTKPDATSTPDMHRPRYSGDKV